jgi:hypothetical protein
MKINAPLYSLNAGEVSKIALARVDVAKLRMAAQCQLNWMPYVVGPMMLRPGLLYSGEVLNDSPTKLMRFVFSKLDTAMIELTANQMRVSIDEVLLTRPSVGTQILDPYFAGTGVNAGAWSTANTTAGASVTIAKDATDDRGSCVLTCTPVGGLAQVEQTVAVAGADQGKEHGIRTVVTNGPVTFRAGSSLGASDLIAQTVLDTGTHSLSCVPTGPSLCIQIESTDQWNKTVTQCSIEAGGTVILPTPWAATDLSNIRYDQSGDIVYVACYGQQQQMIQRRGIRPGARGWSVVLYKTNDGPFNALPTIANVIMTPSVYYGNGTLSASNPFFKPAHVGGLIRLFCSGQNNNCILGAQNAFSDPLRVTGIGADRKVNGIISGTWSGTLSVMRSFEGPTSGFAINTSNTATFTANGGFVYDDVSGNGGSFDNVVVWLKIGFFNPGDYVSGAAAITWGVSPVGGTSGVGGVALSGQYAVCRMTGYNSPTSVDIEAITSPESLALGMVTPIPTLNATANWVEGQWSDVQGWPTSVCFHEGRLCWFGGGQCWLSASDNYTNFADIDFDGTSTGDGGAINITLGSGPLDTVSWGLSLTRLLIGREQSIGSCRSSNFDQPVTPTGIVIRDCSDQGAQRLPAIKVGKRGVFVQQSGRKVYELSFAGQEMDYDDRDLTRLNLDIGLPGFVDIDKSTQPDKMVWLPRGDGQCATLLYDVKDEVDAWWRVQTLGVIENVAVLPGSGTEDTVYFVVRRTINGVSRRFVEKLALRTDCIGGALNKQLDCALVYSGSPVSSVQVPWLPATTLSVWADGTAIGSGTTDASGNLTMPDGLAHSNIVAGLAGSVVTATAASPTATLSVGIQYNGYPCEAFADVGSTGEPIHVGSLVVSNGTITLPNGQQATTIIACLGYVAPFMSAKLAYAAQLGSALTQKKRVEHVGLVMYDTHYQGLQFGQRFDALDSPPLYEADQPTPAGTVWSEYDEPMMEVPGEWNTDARLCLLAQAPTPCTLGGVVIGMTTNERG